ncbi:MAG: alpha-ketoacid dehydrogenase subunit beta [Hahellaceae bacterium]|nr:alpha-ketoacid dehydrogenase subunit beta [Hahellaceae bacterium]
MTNLNTPVVAKLNMVEAVNAALDWELAHDPSVVLLGEDIGHNGGVFRATVGLKEKYGFKRVMDTPLAETLIAGITVGMAAQGLKPVAEIQFMGFIYAAMEHIVSHVSRLRNRTRGRLSCPLVIRAPFGGGIHAPEHHSESTEALFAHIPGLRVVIPSSPARAYGLLLGAIRSPDPVIFLEPKRIYRAVSQPVGVAKGLALPIDRCFTLREGQDLTLISWGAMIHETLQAADHLLKQGISAEVIDVASIKPLDLETLRASVGKTGRAVIVHEAARSGGVGAEIAADLSEHCAPWLKAPIRRVTGYDTIMPYFRNEQHYLPSVDRILAAVGTVTGGRS